MISFVVPAYNEEHELPHALESIHHAAKASGMQYEIIVVDDASTDTTAQIARDAGARVVAINRRQIAAARNAGAHAAQGDILFFVDADTRISPSHIVDGTAALAQGFSGGGARLELSEQVSAVARIMVRAFTAVYFAAGLGAGAFLFTTRENFRKVGGFDEQYFAGEEVYFTLALRKLGRFKILRQPVRTSGRKLRMHSPGHVILRTVSLFFSGPRGVRSRAKLDLWYDGKREGKPAP